MTKQKVETCRPNNTLNRIIKGVFDKTNFIERKCVGGNTLTLVFCVFRLRMCVCIRYVVIFVQSPWADWTVFVGAV